MKSLVSARPRHLCASYLSTLAFSSHNRSQLQNYQEIGFQPPGLSGRCHPPQKSLFLFSAKVSGRGPLDTLRGKGPVSH